MFGFINKIFNKKATGDVVVSEYIQIKVDVDNKAILDEYVAKCSILKSKVTIAADFADGEARRYVYAPKSRPMDANQMLEVAFSLLSRNLDYVVVSNTLDDYPVIGAKCIDDAVVYSSDSCNGIQEIADGKKPLCGRLLRLSGYDKDDTTINLSDSFKTVELKNEFFLVTMEKAIPAYMDFTMEYSFKKEKKLVFVMPIFMAVGGVERNTIEIMRTLQDEYEFVVITMERHAKGQGSLNYQLNNLCHANYDLRELVEFDDYFLAFEQLKKMYNPDVLWLCNNSPWLEANLLKFREVFKDQAIIAQDVYDTKYGWIEYYDTEGIHSLDGYIAINKKIEESFITEHNIPEEKIDVIYPAVDDKKIRTEIAIPVDREGICKKYGLDPAKKHFTYVGRLTAQKNPVRYSKLAMEAMNKYEDMEWVIVGDGELVGEVDKFIEENDLSTKLIRLPYVANVPELYKVIDGLVIVSYYEGMPIVSIEAMSMGVPIFGTDVGDLKIFVDKYNYGNIIPIENENDFEEFEKWYSNYDEYKCNAVKNAREVLDFFSANTLAKLYKQSFEKGMK